MGLFNRFRSEISVFLIIISLGLFALCGYLIYRTVHLHSSFESAVAGTCQTQGTQTLVDIVSDSIGDVVMVYQSEVELLSDGGTPTGLTATCDIGVYCTMWHYSGSIFNCDNAEAFPSSVVCWTTDSQASPSCSLPGENWVGSLVGTVVSAIFAIIFLSLALIIENSKRYERPTNEVEVVGVITGQPVPIVTGSVISPTSSPVIYK